MSLNYYILDNGGLPFKVEIQENHLRVFRRSYNCHLNKYIEDNLPSLELDFLKIFIPGYDNERGNSILIQTEPQKYVYIGSKIYNFQTRDENEITSYYSPIGNNSVPYPWAASETFIYLMLENVPIPRYESTLDINDPYSCYYKLSKRDRNMVEKFQKNILLLPYYFD